jgi:hypothetical protein
MMSLAVVGELCKVGCYCNGFSEMQSVLAVRISAGQRLCVAQAVEERKAMGLPVDIPSLRKVIGKGSNRENREAMEKAVPAAV